MFAEQFFPTTIYAKDVNLDNEFFAKEIVAWSKNNEGMTPCLGHPWPHSYGNFGLCVEFGTWR